MPACFSCCPRLTPTLEELNDPNLFCGGEPICTCDDLPQGMNCPNCGGSYYPCPCGGDGVLPEISVLEEYAFMQAIANDPTLD